MFGYATDETEECMPLTIVLAHKLNAKMAELRRDGTIPWLRPDSKTQVSNIRVKCLVLFLLQCAGSEPLTDIDHAILSAECSLNQYIGQ